MSDVDWRDIFKRYVDIVVEEEGFDFLASGKWAPDEWREICAAVEEANAPVSR